MPIGTIYIDKPGYHSAIFIHGLRSIHGLPVTDEEFAGLNYFETSLKPIVEAHVNYAEFYGFKALGSQVMSQQLFGIPLFERNGVQVQFPGNENNLMPDPNTQLARGTGPHAWFVPLSRWRHLNPDVINWIFSRAQEYESEFFHSGADMELGWEAAIPFTPEDTRYAWLGSDGALKYTDWGRPFEALNTAYTVLSIFDALNPNAPL